MANPSYLLGFWATCHFSYLRPGGATCPPYDLKSQKGQIEGIIRFYAASATCQGDKLKWTPTCQGDKLRSPHVSWVFCSTCHFFLSLAGGQPAFEPLAGGPLSRLAATALPKGEPSLASPFGGGAPLWGGRERATAPPAGKKRFAVSLAFFYALRAYKVKGKVAAF